MWIGCFIHSTDRSPSEALDKPMYNVTGQPGKGCICGWCYLKYGPNRPYGGFMAFTDPMVQPGMQTLYGIECCQRCYQMLYRLGTRKRMQLASGFYRCRPAPKFDPLTELAKQAGEYPPPGKAYKGTPAWGHQGKLLRSLSPVNGVHLSLIIWAENRGPKHFPLNWHKQRGIGRPRAGTTAQLPHRSGRRKPKLPHNEYRARSLPGNRTTRPLSLVQR